MRGMQRVNPVLTLLIESSRTNEANKAMNLGGGAQECRCNQ